MKISNWQSWTMAFKDWIYWQKHCFTCAIVVIWSSPRVKLQWFCLSVKLVCFFYSCSMRMHLLSVCFISYIKRQGKSLFFFCLSGLFFLKWESIGRQKVIRLMMGLDWRLICQGPNSIKGYRFLFQRGLCLCMRKTQSTQTLKFQCCRVPCVFLTMHPDVS